MVILIPKIGIIGAAIASALSLIYMSILGNVYIFYYKRIFLVSYQYLYTIGIGTLVFISLFIVKSFLYINYQIDSFVILVALSLVVYIVFVFSFASNRYDRLMINSVKKKNCKSSFFNFNEAYRTIG